MVKSSRAREGLNKFLQSSQSSSQAGCVTSGFITSLNTCISAVPFSAVWVGGTVMLALYMLLNMALSNLTLFSHTLHTDLGYTIFFFKFFCSAKHNFKIRNCFSADACGSAFHFISRWVVMKSVLLISFFRSIQSQEQGSELWDCRWEKNGHADIN